MVPVIERRASTAHRKAWSEQRRRLHFARVHRPYTLVFGLVLPIPGVLAIIYGDQVSQAFSNIGAGPISRLVGLTLLAGGIATIVGVAIGKSLVEAAGLTIMSAGCVIYGLGVILGLGLGGVIAGSGFISIAAGTILRVVSLATVAHSLERSSDPE